LGSTRSVFIIETLLLLLLLTSHDLHQKPVMVLNVECPVDL